MTRIRGCGAVLLLLCAPAAAASSPMAPAGGGARSFATERRYHESLSELKDGRYHEAMEGFMDVLLEEPDFPGARERLGEAGRRLLEKESRGVGAERDAVLQSMRELARGLDDLSLRRQEARGRWERRFEEVLTLAKSTKDLSLAIQGYERSLRVFPVFSGESREFALSRERFEEALSSAHPEAASAARDARRRGRRGDSGALIEAALRRRKQDAEWSRVGGLELMSLSGAMPGPADTASRIAELERAKAEALGQAESALALYKAARYRECEGAWSSVLELEPDNPEAAFFLARARRLSAGEKGFLPVQEPLIGEARRRTGGGASAGGRAAERGSALPRTPARKRASAKPGPAARKPSAAKEAPPVREEAFPPAAPGASAVQEAERLYQKGLKAYSTGDLEEAIARWQESTLLDPEHPKAKKALRRALNERP